MNPEHIREYFSNAGTVRQYARATASIGLWKSEKLVFLRVFRPADTILDLGTGTGRIAIGLYRCGFRSVSGIDSSNAMIHEARRIARQLRTEIMFEVEDATNLPFPEEKFDGVIFGFNGLMHIPKRENRLRAMGEIYRITKRGGSFVFTTHDRAISAHRKFWRKEKHLWRHGKQKEELEEFGDRCEDTIHGKHFIHVPFTEEIRRDLKASGFKIEGDFLRSQIANESPQVREFSDECRFWIAAKPAVASGDR